ncbi:hypothetical protein F4804DRAFT_324404 [Jackrogersella minutella]|nr:hypothetical protein F4804DRAFT_324404 [Jackrogersella minutella]
MSSSAPQRAQVPKKLLPSILKRPLASAEDYELRAGPGWTVNDGTFPHVSQSKRRKRDVPHPINPDLAHHSMYGLTSLQLAHNAPITMCAMDVATEHLWKCLPPGLRTQVAVCPPNGPELWGSDEDAAQEMYNKMKQSGSVDDETKTDDYYTNLKRQPWVVWPLWVEDEHGMDWVLVVWYAEATPSSLSTYDYVRAYGIYDPRRDPEANSRGKHTYIGDRLDRIGGRLEDFLRRGGYTLDSDIVSGNGNICPMPLNEASSGERCFAAVKDILAWILDLYMSNKAFDPDEQNLPSLSRWVEPYQYRIEMAGINSWTLMSTFNYEARITVELIAPGVKTDVIADGRRRWVRPTDLSGLTNRPDIASGYEIRKVVEAS